MRLTHLLTAILVVAPLTGAAAQPSLGPGDRVRISARGAQEQVFGMVISLSSEALVIEGKTKPPRASSLSRRYDGSPGAEADR